jgi:hypothetical protein
VSTELLPAETVNGAGEILARHPMRNQPYEAASAVPPPACGKLAAALAKAQSRCRAASKDSRNDFHKYKYASAEAIMEEAKIALADCELSVIPLGHEMRVSGNGSAAFYEVHRQFLIAHSSGECLTLPFPWPVCPDRGRPLDKALAGAMTTSLAYFLRDLLQMPRVDPSEQHMDSRDDRRPQRGTSPSDADSEVPPGKPPRMGSINGEQATELAATVTKWEAALAEVRNGDAGDLNHLIPEFRKIGGHNLARRRVWQMIEAAAAEKGWAFDSKVKQFVAPDGVK